MSYEYEPLPERVERAAKETVDSAFRVHTRLGPGLLEAIYEESLTLELRKKGFKVITQLPMPMKYDGDRLSKDIRIDMIVDDCLLVEVKATKETDSYYFSQVLTYLEVTRIRLGLLINFGRPHLKQNIRRIIR